VYGAEFGEVPALQTLFKILNKPFLKNFSPNPLYAQDAFELIKAIQSQLPSIPDWMKKNDKQVIGFGGKNCVFNFGVIATGKTTYSKEEVFTAILNECGKTDEQLTQYPVREAIVGLILVYSIMDHCGFETVTYAKTNGSCEGMLVSPHFWERETSLLLEEYY